MEFLAENKVAFSLTHRSGCGCQGELHEAYSGPSSEGGKEDAGGDADSCNKMRVRQHRLWSTARANHGKRERGTGDPILEDCQMSFYCFAGGVGRVEARLSSLCSGRFVRRFFSRQGKRNSKCGVRTLKRVCAQLCHSFRSSLRWHLSFARASSKLRLKAEHTHFLEVEPLPCRSEVDRARMASLARRTRNPKRSHDLANHKQ